MHEIPTSDWTRINAAADRFECAWDAGERPRIEDYLAEAEPGLRPALLDELLRVELELRREGGDEPGADEYLRRFPGDAPVVEAVFRGGKPARPRADGSSSGPRGSGSADSALSPIASILAALSRTIGS